MSKPWMVAVLILLVLSTPALASHHTDKFLVIHLDGVAADSLSSYLAAGSLPAMGELFSGGQRAGRGITVFPGETPLVLTRMRQGYDSSQGIVGWSYLEHETGKRVGLAHTFLEMMGQVSRLSRNQFFFQYPGLNHLVGLSLLNIGRYWATHDVLEVYWLNTDTIGHLRGSEGQLESLQRFDRYLDLAAKSGQLEGVNVILYTDHGSTLDDVHIVHYQTILPDLLGEDLQYLYYPNIYLYEPTKKVELAQKIVTDTTIDLAMIRESGQKVVGYSLGGSFEINSQDDTYQYIYHGLDYFGYGQLGYKGEFLTKEEWLALTKDHWYPGTIPSIFGFLQNPDAGHIVFVLNGPQIPYYVLGPKGHHAGLTRDDQVVSLFLSGPAFHELEPVDAFWLHEMFTKHLPMVDFNSEPHRERHSLTYFYPHSGEIVLSPAPRWRGGLALSRIGLSPWVEYDVYSSLLTRIWVGAGYSDQTLRWRVKVEAFLGDFGLSWFKQRDVEREISVHWRFHEQAELSIGRGRVGVSLLF